MVRVVTGCVDDSSPCLPEVFHSAAYRIGGAYLSRTLVSPASSIAAGGSHSCRVAAAACIQLKTWTVLVHLLIDLR